MEVRVRAMEASSLSGVPCVTPGRRFPTRDMRYALTGLALRALLLSSSAAATSCAIFLHPPHQCTRQYPPCEQAESRRSSSSPTAAHEGHGRAGASGGRGQGSSVNLSPGARTKARQRVGAGGLGSERVGQGGATDVGRGGEGGGESTLFVMVLDSGVI